MVLELDTSGQRYTLYMYQKISISIYVPQGVCPGVAGAEEEGVGEH